MGVTRRTNSASHPSPSSPPLSPPTAPPLLPPTARATPRRNRSDGRLDPVRRHRPARGTLLRLVAVAALLALAAYASWSPPRSCQGPGVAGGLASTPPKASPSAAAPRTSAIPMPAGIPMPAAVPPGRVGVPIRLADPTALALVHPGNHVDLLRVNEADGQTTAIAAAAEVLQVTGAADPTSGALLLALSPAEANRAVAFPGHGFAILIRPD